MGCSSASDGTGARGAALACAVALVITSLPARAGGPSPDPDPWFGPDKALHFAAGMTLSAAGYAVGVVAFDERWAGVALGTSTALALAGAKEGLDAAGLGQPSWRDFVWSALGAALGMGVAVTFDAALRGVEHAEP